MKIPNPTPKIPPGVWGGGVAAMLKVWTNLDVNDKHMHGNFFWSGTTYTCPAILKVKFNLIQRLIRHMFSKLILEMPPVTVTTFLSG